MLIATGIGLLVALGQTIQGVIHPEYITEFYNLKLQNLSEAQKKTIIEANEETIPRELDKVDVLLSEDKLEYEEANQIIHNIEQQFSSVISFNNQFKLNQFKSKSKQMEKDMRTLMDRVGTMEEKMTTLSKDQHDQTRQVIEKNTLNILEEQAKRDEEYSKLLRDLMSDLSEQLGGVSENLGGQLREVHGNLDGRLGEVHQGLDGRLSEVHQGLDGRLGEVHQGLDGRLSEVHQGLDGRLGEVHQGLDGRLSEVHQGLDGRLSEVHQGLDGRLSEVHQGLDGRLSEVHQGLDGRLSEVHQGLDGRLSEVHQGLDGRLSEVHQGLDGRLSEVHQGLDGRLSEVHQGLDGRLSEVHQGLDGRLSEVHQGLDGRLSEVHQGLGRQVADTHQEVKGARQDVTQVSRQVVDTHQEVKGARQDVTQVSRQVADTHQEVKGARQDVTQVSRQVVDTHQEVKGARQDVTQVSRQVADTHQEVKGARQDVTQVSRQVADTHQEVKGARQDVMQVSRQVADTHQEVKGARQDVTQVSRQVADTHQEVKGARQDVTQVSRQVADTHQEVKGARQDVTQVSRQVADTHQEVKGARQDVMQVSRQVADTHQEIKGARQDISVVGRDVRIANQKIEETRQKIFGVIEKRSQLNSRRLISDFENKMTQIEKFGQKKTSKRLINFYQKNKSKYQDLYTGIMKNKKSRDAILEKVKNINFTSYTPQAHLQVLDKIASDNRNADEHDIKESHNYFDYFSQKNKEVEDQNEIYTQKTQANKNIMGKFKICEKNSDMKGITFEDINKIKSYMNSYESNKGENFDIALVATNEGIKYIFKLVKSTKCISKDIHKVFNDLLEGRMQILQRKLIDKCKQKIDEYCEVEADKIKYHALKIEGMNDYWEAEKLKDKAKINKEKNTPLSNQLFSAAKEKYQLAFGKLRSAQQFKKDDHELNSNIEAVAKHIKLIGQYLNQNPVVGSGVSLTSSVATFGQNRSTNSHVERIQRISTENTFSH